MPSEAWRVTFDVTSLTRNARHVRTFWYHLNIRTRYLFIIILVRLALWGTIVNRTYGVHKNLPGIYLTIFTNNIRSC